MEHSRTPYIVCFGMTAAGAGGYDETPTKLLTWDVSLEEVIGRRDEKVTLQSFSSPKPASRILNDIRSNLALNNNAMLPYAVIFDMDGVLADTEPLHGACFVEAFSRFGFSVTLEDYRQAVTLGGSTVRDYFARLGGDLSDWDEVKAIKDGLLSEATAGQVQPIPGVVELLESLKSEGVPTALATSARRRSMQIILDQLDLWDCFTVFVTKDEADAEKPSPEIFLIAAGKLGVKPEDCLVIEDSPRGVTAAARAGMKCIAVPTPSTADGDFSLAALVADSIGEVNLQLMRSIFRTRETTNDG